MSLAQRFRLPRSKHMIVSTVVALTLIATSPIWGFELLYHWALWRLPALPTCPQRSFPRQALAALSVTEGDPGKRVPAMWAGNLFVGSLRGQGRGRYAAVRVAQVFAARTIPRSVRVTRALEEASIMVWLSRHASPDQLNRELASWEYFGRGAVGLHAAARAWFGHDLRDLDLAQVAFLAGLPADPNTYDPESNAKAARARRAYVLVQIKKAGFISAEELREAEREPIAVVAPAPR